MAKEEKKTEALKKAEDKKVEASKKVEAKKAEASKKVEAKKECKCEKCSCKKNGVAVTALVFAILALGAGTTAAVFSILAYQKNATPLTILNSDIDGNSSSVVEGSMVDIVEQVSKSVVSIVTSVRSTGYFGRSYESQASGTGIIVTEDGYILTNKHVIEDAKSISVVLDDGTTYKNVKVAAVDGLNDIAFLKIKGAEGLKAAVLGDSKTVKVGQQVIAIGNALGEYQNTVTGGVVSGTGRSITASDAGGYNTERLNDMIQTDAAINSGNSGGPLINAAGQVIGVNTANSNTSAENLGFAIPIAAVKGMLAQLKEDGEAERAYLGVYITDLTPDTAKKENLSVTTGAYLYSDDALYAPIISDSPAEKAGLKEKDIITAVNGAKIGVAGSLSTLIGEYKPGDTVQLTVVRDGNEIAINVTLGAYED